MENFNFISGTKKDKKDKRDYRACGVVATPKAYPEVFELEEKFEPKMQWGRGSCTSQGQGHHKERQEGVKLSARFIMAIVKTFIEKNTGYGGYTRNSFKAVQKWGVPEEKLYPEPGPEMSWEEYIDATLIPSEVEVDALKHKSDSYWRLNKTLNEIKDILLTKNSVEISMAWYKEFNIPMSDGTLPSYLKANYVGGHAVEVVGWDDKSQLLKIKNSWLKNWGKNGFFYMPYSFINDLIWDLWTSLDIPKNVPVDELYGNFYQPIDKWRDTYITGKVLLKYKRFPTRRELNALLNYWDYETVFEGKNGDIWLHYTWLEAVIKNLI